MFIVKGKVFLLLLREALSQPATLGFQMVTFLFVLAINFRDPVIQKEPANTPAKTDERACRNSGSDWAAEDIREIHKGTLPEARNQNHFKTNLRNP